MGTIAKVALWFFGGVLALVAVVAAALFFMEWNLLRTTVNERASAASGRAVEIRGDLRVDLWSWTPEVTAQDVVFGNPPWASEPDMLRVAEVYLKFRLMPIFAGRLEVERLRLVRPQLALERRDGKANWQLQARTPSEAAVEAAAPAEREDFPVLKHLTVEDASLTYRDTDLAEPIEVELAKLTVEAGGLEDPVSLKAEGRYLDRPFMLQGEGESFEKFRSTEEPYDLTLEARIGDTRLTARGALDEPVQLVGVDATLDLQGENLHELFTLFALPLPESPPYAIAGQLTREGDRWALRDFEGRLGKSDLRGTLEVATGGERPRLVADVASNAFRAEDLEGFWGEEDAGEDDAAGAAADDGHILSDEPLSLPKLRRMDAEVRFGGKSIESGALRLQDLSAELRLDDGLLTVTPLVLGLAEGRITADLRLDGRDELPKMAGDVTVEGLDVNALLALLGQENAAAGRLQGRLKMTMQGRSMRELGGSANGEGALIMSGGRIENILLELLALDLQEAVGQWLTEDRSRVEVLCLAMPTRIESGRFIADPWILDTTDAIVTITGYVDLGTEQVQIELEPHPKDFSLFNYLTSIEVSGDLSERTASTSPLEAVGKLVLKTLAVPVMPLLSESIEEEARERSVPCPSLRKRLQEAMAEGDDDLPADAADGGEAEGAAAPASASPVPDGAADAATVSRIQSALNETGFDLAVDGIMGPDTEAALREFQARRNLQPSGRPDAGTLRQLGLAPDN